MRHSSGAIKDTISGTIYCKLSASSLEEVHKAQTWMLTNKYTCPFSAAPIVSLHLCLRPHTLTLTHSLCFQESNNE